MSKRQTVFTVGDSQLTTPDGLKVQSGDIIVSDDVTVVGSDGRKWGPIELVAVTAALKATDQPITACSDAELNAFLKNKPEPGAVAPSGEVFVDWRKNGEALLMFGILPEMSRWLENDDTLNALMIHQGLSLMGRRYVRPDEEDGNLIDQHQNKGVMESRVAQSKFEDGSRSFWLSVPVGTYGARVQHLYHHNQSNRSRRNNYSSCAVRRVAPQP